MLHCVVGMVDSDTVWQNGRLWCGDLYCNTQCLFNKVSDSQYLFCDIGSIPLSKAYTRRYGQPSYMNPLNQQFPALRRSSGRFSSMEDSPLPPLPMKRTNVTLDDAEVSPTAPFVHHPQASPITTSTPVGSPSSEEVVADDTTGGQQFDVPQPVTEYTTKLAGKLAAKRKASAAKVGTCLYLLQ